MGQQVSLEDAAREVGKSLITIRRAVKSGKLHHQKIKTLTGFVYTVDVAEAKAFFNGRSSVPYHAVTEELKQIKQELRADHQENPNPTGYSDPTRPQPVPPVQNTQSKYRIAVAGESGSLTEYWQKRAEAYEERYYRELTKHSETREELGVWKGKSENAETMFQKLLNNGSVNLRLEKENPPLEGADLTTEEVDKPAELIQDSAEVDQMKSVEADSSSNQEAAKPSSPAPSWLVWLIIILAIIVLGFGGTSIYLFFKAG